MIPEEIIKMSDIGDYYCILAGEEFLKIVLPMQYSGKALRDYYTDIRKAWARAKVEIAKYEIKNRLKHCRTTEQLIKAIPGLEEALLGKR